MHNHLLSKHQVVEVAFASAPEATVSMIAGSLEIHLVLEDSSVAVEEVQRVFDSVEVVAEARGLSAVEVEMGWSHSR